MKLRSIWKLDAPSRARPTLDHDLDVDVAIIGGGITGLTTAHLLLDSQARVAVLEARRVGEGSTGHSTGNLYATVDQHFGRLRKRYDDLVTRAVAEARSGGIALIEGLVRRHHIACDFVRVPFWLVADDDDALAHVNREVEAAHKAGVVARAMAPNEIPLPFPTKGAAQMPQQAQIQPLQYVRGLADALPSDVVFEHSPVVDIEEADSGATLTTSAGVKVRAAQVLMATHTPKGNSFAHLVLAPYREHAVALRLRSRDELPPPGIYWVVSGEQHHSLRRVVTDDGHGYLVVLGRPYKVGQDDPRAQPIADIVAYARQRFAIDEVAYAWGAQAYRPADGLPYIGPRASGSRISFATGFAADGLVWGTVAAQMIDDQVHSRPNPYAELFAYTRHRPIKSAGAFVRENINVALQYLRDWPLRSDGPELSSLPSDDGKVVEVGAHKVAVHRDRTGKLHAVSAVCTHLGCIVRFNHVERSWDCPCHGSRFGIDGTVLEGPALTPLARMPLDGKEEES